jgi:hypothetical protein
MHEEGSEVSLMMQPFHAFTGITLPSTQGFLLCWDDIHYHDAIPSEMPGFSTCLDQSSA